MAINQWANSYDYLNQEYGNIVVSEDRPIDNSEKQEWYIPVISLKRVHGSRYTPYVAGSKAWRDAANKALANEAQSNFAKGRGWR